jgi:imidazolonepropionase-like amidohydrolase
VALTPFNSLPGELERLVADIGLSPVAAIAAGTSGAARALGVADTLGTLAPGQIADLIAVEGDPSVRIEDVRNVRRVIKAGRTVAQDGVLLV